MSLSLVNFGKVTVSTGYSSAATSVVLTTGHGARLPATFPFPLVWWNATDYTDPADDPSREIVNCTARTSDTLTVLRAQEGTSASNKNLSAKTYKMIAAATASVLNQLLTFSSSQTVRNLHLRTSTIASLAAVHVELTHADAIVMNDGQEVQDWNMVESFITTSGVGGLDTGTEQISTWYEIHAVYDGVNKGLILHRAPNYFNDEAYTAGEDASQGLRDNANNATNAISQGFILGSSGPLEFIDIKLLRTGSPSGNVWLEIHTNAAGVPSGTIVAAEAISDLMEVSRISTTSQWVRFRFRTPPSLSASVQYHIVMWGTHTVSAANYISWRMDGSAAAYGNGSKALYDSDTGTWTADTDDDMMFSLFTKQNNTALTMPAGYTSSAHIGYVYNNSSGNLNRFYQKDRTVFQGYSFSSKVGALTTSTPTLGDLFTVLPPIATVVQLMVYNASASSFVAGELDATDLSTTVTVETDGTVRAVLAAGGIQSIGDLVLDKYQGFMYAVSVGTANVYIQRYTW